jgi:hypothetical protein
MTNSQVRDFEFVESRCIRDITITGTAPFVTVNSDWARVVLQSGSSLYYNLTTNAAPVTTLPTATGLYTSCEIDVEKQILCDLAVPATPVTFLRIFVYDASNGAQLYKADFAEDGVTPYVVSAEANVDPCGGEAEMTYTTNGVVATNAAPVIIPANAKSFTITNLGLNGEAIVFSPINVTGIVGTTTIPAVLDSVTYSVEEDQDGLNATTVTVTPAAGHQVWVQWII